MVFYNTLILERKSQIGRGFRMNMLYTFFQFFPVSKKKKTHFTFKVFQKKLEIENKFIAAFQELTFLQFI